MKEKTVIFSKEVSFQDLTKEIELIHQLGFFVEVKSLGDSVGVFNMSYELCAVTWDEIEEWKK